MKTSKLLLIALVSLLLLPTVRAGEMVDRLLAEYAKIETVTCQIRRTKEGAIGKIKFLSRVYWTNKGQLHAEGISPVKRRTIADGKRLWQYADGDPKGFSRPIGELSEQMSISLRMVPGTPMDHLLHMKGLPETVLPSDDAADRRIGIQTDTNYVVLLLDSNDRLVGVEFFKTAEMKEKIATYVYSDLTEVVPGTWIPFTHQISTTAGDSLFTETVKVDRYIANKPVAESLFIASSFFDKDIDFVDDFAKIYPE
ncbi:MAG: hypothetical protein K9M54_03745 [Kiritimatiellales bacterium]|nr:hypothetical protein [Kiritimatiellales bacterium]MCF7863405.1 hypothetical protein [Kiritimatiellales bacterium]